MDQAEDSILIFFGAEPKTPEVRRGLKSTLENMTGKMSEVAVTTMQENMSRFLHSLSLILDTQSEEVAGLVLDQVEINAQIDGKGNIGITGMAAAELAAHGGIKLILRRKS